MRSDTFLAPALAGRHCAGRKQYPRWVFPGFACRFSSWSWVVWTLPETQGKIVESEALYQRSLAILENALGGEHPSVGETLARWAMLYVHQVRLSVVSTHTIRGRPVSLWR